MKYTINELANSKGVSPLVREALLQMEAELEATNRQVEILSDALAESRREVAAFKAVQEPVAWMHWLHGPVQPFMNKQEAMMELDRLNREYPVDNHARKMRPLVFGDTTPPAQPAPVPEPVEVDQTTMKLAESVGLIGPASRTHDLHAAIQRFHDLICVNATIKAAKMAADAISESTPPAAQRPWVGLTQEEFRDFASTLDYGTGGLIRAIEAKLKEKNT